MNIKLIIPLFTILLTGCQPDFKKEKNESSYLPTLISNATISTCNDQDQLKYVAMTTFSMNPYSDYKVLYSEDGVINSLYSMTDLDFNSVCPVKLKSIYESTLKLLKYKNLKVKDGYLLFNDVALKIDQIVSFTYKKNKKPIYISNFTYSQVELKTGESKFNFVFENEKEAFEFLKLIKKDKLFE